MNKWEIEALASAVAKRLNVGPSHHASQVNVSAVASAVASVLAGYGSGSFASDRLALTSAPSPSFASSISKKTASGIAARLASDVTKKMDQKLGNYVASAVMHRLSENTLDGIASQIAKKVASRANVQTKNDGLKTHDTSIDE